MLQLCSDSVRSPNFNHLLQRMCLTVARFLSQSPIHVATKISSNIIFAYRGHNIMTYYIYLIFMSIFHFLRFFRVAFICCRRRYSSTILSLPGRNWRTRFTFGCNISFLARTVRARYATIYYNSLTKCVALKQIGRVLEPVPMFPVPKFQNRHA